MILIPLALILISSLVALFILKKHKYSNTLRVPPGPKPWPIIGNLNLMGSLPHQSLHKLSQTYGPIIHLKFGSFPVVVVSSPDIAKQVLKTNDHLLAGRPRMAAGKYTTYNYSNLTWAPYGPYWRQGRKIYLNELFSSKRLASYEYIRVEERRAFTARLFSSRGCQVVLKDHLSRLTLSVISRIVLGRKYFSCDDDGDEFQEMLDELFLLNGVLNIGDWIPWMDLFDLQGYVRRMKGLKVKFDRFHEFVLDEHRIRMGRHVVGKEEDDFEKRDMVDHLLRLANDPNLDVKLNDDSVKGFLPIYLCHNGQDLIAGGTDTSATTVEWAMSELMKQPKLIEKATKELDEVVGRERWVEERDIPNLPFIDAIMKETMRKHPVAVLLAPHLALEDCTLGGYDVAKDTRVFINTWSMGRDPSVWAHPEEFMPERFLGELNMDVKGQCYELLPFGSGRRMCPGYSLGLKMISSTLANLLHGFDWKLPQGVAPEDLSMDEVYGLATPRKYPLVAIVEPRLPISLYDHHY
ncbi:Trimethyltridecatetraene synthase [Linum perenne]